MRTPATSENTQCAFMRATARSNASNIENIKRAFMQTRATLSNVTLAFMRATAMSTKLQKNIKQAFM